MNSEMRMGGGGDGGNGGIRTTKSAVDPRGGAASPHLRLGVRLNPN